MRLLIAMGLICGLCSLGLYATAQRKGGESCEKDSECATGKCRSNKTCDPCPDRDNCPPPGECSSSDYSSYAGEVHKVCDKERSCERVTSFNDKEARYGALMERFENGESCLKARDNVMQRCFKGGDRRHQDERRAVSDVRDTCKSLIDTKKGKYLLYTCSDSDLESYDRKIESACRKDNIVCTESKNSDKIDCRKLEDKIKTGGECKSARTEAADRCFDGRWNWRRQADREGSDAALETCKDVLRYKQDNKLCL